MLSFVIGRPPFGVFFWWSTYIIHLCRPFFILPRVEL